MKFWDSSAIVPLLVEQSQTHRLRKIHQSDLSLIVWWATESECFSALARLEREDLLIPENFNLSARRLTALSESWTVVTPTQAIKDEAKRILRMHPLRCADAFQLAAAILASEKSPATLEFVTLDQRLADSASKEGFVVIS